MNDADQLRRLLLERSVRRGDFILASGQRSSYYIDCRPTTMSAEGQVLIGRLGLAALHAAGWQPRGIGGLTMGADPVAYAVAAASWSSGSPIDAFSVRKEAKSYGAGRLIEGNFQPGDPVVVTEDVITTGGSAERAISAVIEAGGRVLGVLAVVDREQGGREHLIERGHKVVSITTTSQLGLVPSAGTAL
ncbi:MAG TPA: orotate phosphoribosyltransferase [Gemmatimonadales bacterium]|nr:orotate phosphoribosyltransferase [Gemmatimonadales bacterium]